MITFSAGKILKALMAIAVLCMLIGTRVIAEEVKTNPVIVSQCQQDLLLKQLKLKTGEVKVVDVKAVTWPDAALGMPESGKLYAQVLTPGWRIVLEVKNSHYLYTASDKVFKFGGPLALWNSSILYLLPVMDEPNMNGDLYQCSMTGINNSLLVSGVSAYYPQAKGTILITRRTSRSGFEMVSVNAGKHDKKPQTLYSAFDIGAGAFNESQDSWAAFARPGIGTGWNIAVAKIGDEKAVTLPLPADVKPQKIAWAGEMVMIQVGKDKGTIYYEINPKAATPEWKAINSYRFPGAMDFVLNKSESLEIEQVGTKEKPKVEIATVWFTGDRKLVATIPGLSMRGNELFGGYAFIWGEQDDKTVAFSVRISTGAITPGFSGNCQDMKVFNYPPVSVP